MYLPSETATTGTNFWLRPGVLVGLSALFFPTIAGSSGDKAAYLPDHAISQAGAYYQDISKFVVNSIEYILVRLGEILQKYPAVAKQVSDARIFSVKLPALVARPLVWSDGETEVALEWINHEKHAIVTFEGDGEFGYAMRETDRFVPGKVVGQANAGPPDDLLRYFRQI
jgi:hypothetical protein